MKEITIFTSGVSDGNPGPALIEVRLIDSDGATITEMTEAIGNATTVFAEYEAVMRGLQMAREQFQDETKKLKFDVRLTSEFVKKQLGGEQEIKEPGLVPHFIEIHNMRVSAFPNLTFSTV